MTQLLDLIERVVPRLRHYPRWAQRLFAVSFAMTLASFFLWVVMAPAAARHLAHGSVQLDVGIGPNSAGRVPGGGARSKALRPLALSVATVHVLNRPVTYTLAPGTRTIAPDVPYVALVRRGGPLGGVDDFDWWQSAARLPDLDVKLANTGTKKVFLTSAAVHVARSAPDLEPIPVVMTGRPDEPDSFELRNEGWGAMQHVVVHYAVRGGVAPAASSPAPYRANVPAIRDARLVSVRGGVAAARLPAPGRSTVSGTFTYTWHDADGNLRRGRDSFVTTVYLAKLHPIAGEALNVTSVYHVTLRVSGRDYDVAVPGFDRFIDANSPDRFELRTYAPRSSLHTGVTIRLVYSDGYAQRSKPFNVRIFEPRNAPVVAP